MQEIIIQRVSEAFPGASVNVVMEGNKALIEVVSEAFAGLNRVKRQQAVYACIQDFIADGSVHAVTIKALEPDV